MRKSLLKIIIAVLIAPWAAVVTTVLFSLIVTLFFQLRTSEAITLDDFFELISMAGFAIPIAYAGTIVIGLPTHLLLRYINRNTRLVHTIVGILYGSPFLLLAIAQAIGTKNEDLETGAILFVLLFFFCTVAVSTAFGIIVNYNMIENAENAKA